MIFRKKYFWSSVIAHLFLLVGASIIFLKNNSLEQKIDGNIIQISYLIEAQQEKHHTQATHLSHKWERSTPKVAGEGFAGRHSSSNALSDQKPSPVALRTPTSPASGRGEKLKLTDLLHQAITAQQHYPESATELKQTGTVSLEFLLHPNGQIENIRIKQSSQFDSLDQAAIEAVQAASPVENINKYLKKPEILWVDILFKL